MRHIAVVDDNPLVRASMDSLLRALGFRVSVFESVPAVLAHPLDAFDCVISDIDMPGASGLDLQNAMSRLRPDLPMIFCTALHDEAVRSHALSAGATAILHKPDCAGGIVSQLEQLLV